MGKKTTTLDKMSKALKFVEHIEAHLKDLAKYNPYWTEWKNAKVMCKICNKTIDEIAEESK